MIKQGMKVTIEPDIDHDYNGRSATVLAVLKCFAIVDIDGVGYRGILVDSLQPKMTAEMFASRFTGYDG